MNHKARCSVGIFFVVFLTHVISPNATPFDSRWSVFTAHSLIYEHNADLNEFKPALIESQFYAIECVGSDHRHTYPVDETMPCDRYYNFYPIAVPVLAAPFVLAMGESIQILQPWLGPIAANMPTAARRDFLRGDMVAASTLVEVVIASIIIAFAAVFMYLIGFELLSPGRALAVPLLFAFCTPAWSTGSRALWQHGPSMLLIAAALWLTLIARRRPSAIRYVGAVLMLAVFVRPTNVVPLACFTIYVWFRFRDQFVRYVCWAAPVAVAFCVATYVTYGTPLAPYAFAKRGNAPGLSIHARTLEAFVGNMISPGRGLLVFTPVFLYCLYGVIRRAPDVDKRDLTWLSAATIAGHWILISLYEDWWGGHSFGPRYFSDLTPLFVFLLVPSVGLLFRPSHRGHTIAFLALAAFSFLVHFRGATAWATMEWNVKPVNLRNEPERVWNWKDLQFLR